MGRSFKPSPKRDVLDLAQSLLQAPLFFAGLNVLPEIIQHCLLSFVGLIICDVIIAGDLDYDTRI